MINIPTDFFRDFITSVYRQNIKFELINKNACSEGKLQTGCIPIVSMGLTF